MPITTPRRGFALQVAQRRCGSGFSRDEASRVARASRVTPTVIAPRAPKWRERCRVDGGTAIALCAPRAESGNCSHKDTKTQRKNRSLKVLGRSPRTATAAPLPRSALDHRSGQVQAGVQGFSLGPQKTRISRQGAKLAKVFQCVIGMVRFAGRVIRVPDLAPCSAWRAWRLGVRNPRTWVERTGPRLKPWTPEDTAARLHPAGRAATLWERLQPRRDLAGGPSVAGYADRHRRPRTEMTEALSRSA